MAEINSPFGDADLQILSAGGAQAITVNNHLTILKSVSVEAVMTINLTLNAGLRQGALLIVDLLQDSGAGDDVTFGTGMTGPVLTGVASDRDIVTFYFDGTAFIQISNLKAIDAA